MTIEHRGLDRTDWTEAHRLNAQHDIITSLGHQPCTDPAFWEAQADACIQVSEMHRTYAPLAAEDGLETYTGNDVCRWIEQGRLP